MVTQTYKKRKKPANNSIDKKVQTNVQKNYKKINVRTNVQTRNIHTWIFKRNVQRDIQMYKYTNRRSKKQIVQSNEQNSRNK